MSIQSISGSSPSYQSPEALASARQTLVLKKANDEAKIEAQGLTELVKSAAAGPTTQGINVYA
jgi:hypothetical protein